MVKYGDFILNNVLLKSYEPSKYKPLNNSYGSTYNLFIRTHEDEEEDLFIIANIKGVDICSIERHKKPINVKGAIYKNPRTHKTLFIVDQDGYIEEA